MLDAEKILQRADDLYAEAKCGPDVWYMPPEARPKIASRQVRAVVTALVEALNSRWMSRGENT